MSKFIVLAMFLCLQGCATPYQRAGFGGGFQELALNEDTYIVSFAGNGFTSSDKVNAYLLRRGAELTIEKGYNYFIILDGKQETISGKIVLSEPRYETTGYGDSYYTGNAYGNSFSANGVHNFHSATTFHPGNSINMQRHASKIIIKMFKTNENNHYALNAKVILSNFSQ